MWKTLLGLKIGQRIGTPGIARVQGTVASISLEHLNMKLINSEDKIFHCYLYSSSKECSAQP